MAENDNLEGLAKAMHHGLDDFDPAVQPLPFEELAGWCQEAYRRQARAALAHLGFDPAHPPEEGAARLLVEAARLIVWANEEDDQTLFNARVQTAVEKAKAALAAAGAGEEA